MKTEFIEHLHLLRFKDKTAAKKPGSLIVDENYHVKVLNTQISVPKGFTTDLASFPKDPIFGITFGDKLGPTMEAAIVHDFLYSGNNSYTFTRKQADEAFFDLLRLSKVPLWQARLYWLAVRAFGWTQYKGYKE